MESADLDLIRRWLSEPHVARWFLAGSSIDAEVDDIRRSLDGSQPTEALVVLQDDRPIGWCQWYLCSDYPDHAAGVGSSAGDVGIDYAIGESSCVGRGTGTALIAALVAYVRRRLPSAGIVADPEAANMASRRVLEKNGFQLLAERVVPSEPVSAPMAIYRLPPPRHPER